MKAQTCRGQMQKWPRQKLLEKGERSVLGGLMIDQKKVMTSFVRLFRRPAGMVIRAACLLLVTSAFSFLTRVAIADPNYIANLTFSDRSSGSTRAKPYDSILRLDANDTSFAAPANWGGGFDSWQKQFDHTKSLAVSHPAAGLVFIGDSVTQGWGNVNGRAVNGHGVGVWNSAQYNYSRFGALNLGIAGDQTQNLIYRAEHGQFNGLNPGLVVLMIGTNNRLAPSSNPGFPIQDYPAPAHTANEIADGVLAAVQSIHKQLPNSHILALSVLRGLNVVDPERIAADQANAIVSQAFAIDTNPTLDYLDISSSFRKADGTINSNLMGDGVHLNTSGYLVWADAIAPYVNQFAKIDPSSYVVNAAPKGTASWSNSVDGQFGHFAQDAIDDNWNTINHGDLDGSAGGNFATPDVLTVELDHSYNLKSVQIVNRGAVDGGSAVSDARLGGVQLQVLGASGNDILYSATLSDDMTLLGETLTFDNGGQGFIGAKFIRLTATGFLHVAEIRANVAGVPETGSLMTVNVGCASVSLMVGGRESRK